MLFIWVEQKAPSQLIGSICILVRIFIQFISLEFKFCVKEKQNSYFVTYDEVSILCLSLLLLLGTKYFFKDLLEDFYG
jgi:hypothetical protein